MKEKIFILIIGILTGAVLATGVFFTYTLISNSGKCRDNQIGMNRGSPPGMNNGNSNSNQPPDIPSGENNNQNSNNNQPPEKPGDDNQQNNQQNNNT